MNMPGAKGAMRFDAPQPQTFESMLSKKMKWLECLEEDEEEEEES